MTLALQPWPEDTTAASWGSIGSTEQMREDTSHAPRADARGIVINDGGIFFFSKLINRKGVLVSKINRFPCCSRI